MKFYNLAGLGFLAGAAAAVIAPIVTIASGVIAGTTTTATIATWPSSSTIVVKYVGIPYASSPPLRYAPAVPPASWTTTLQAVNTAPACIQKPHPISEQLLFNNPGGPFPPESEDCLYLNIYVPSNATAKSGLAILFWIFGGDFQSGEGSLLRYDGSSFAANQNVIIVTHNYRTNLLGFSQSPLLPLTQRNAGFLDTRLALKWVHDNIATFGGDPTKVTLFGESSGAFSIEQLIAFPPTPMTFRAAIFESRSFNSPGNVTTGWTQAVSALGCSSSTDTLACMRSVSALAIKSAVTNISYGPAFDGATCTNDIRPRLLKGAAKVPVLIGTNAQEGTVFAYLDGLQDPDANLTTALQLYFGNTTLVNLLVGLVTNVSNVPYVTAAKLITDVAFTCTSSLLASSFNSFGYPTWRYYFNASFPNTAVFPLGGAYHSSELGEVFGTYEDNSVYGFATESQKALSVYMQTAWANFAKDPTSNPQKNWPPLGLLGNVQSLGSAGSRHANNGSSILAAQIDYVCPLYDLIIGMNGF